MTSDDHFLYRPYSDDEFPIDGVRCLTCDHFLGRRPTDSDTPLSGAFLRGPSTLNASWFPTLWWRGVSPKGGGVLRVHGGRLLVRRCVTHVLLNSGGGEARFSRDIHAWLTRDRLRPVHGLQRLLAETWPIAPPSPHLVRAGTHHYPVRATWRVIGEVVGIFAVFRQFSKLPGLLLVCLPMKDS